MEHLEVLIHIMIVVRIASFQMLSGNDFDQILIEQRDINWLSMGARFWHKSFSATNCPKSHMDGHENTGNQAFQPRTGVFCCFISRNYLELAVKIRLPDQVIAAIKAGTPTKLIALFKL